ncbi:MAG: anthranilate phosphoribosyltransferase, partial [Rhodospirillaceae bacterium]|nr:anthranilate phosphoribosyltransferase [Rhodospirillaceae bacterium]
LKGGDAKHNAKALTALLEGEAGPYRDIVLLNAAASLIVAGKVDDLKSGVQMAAAAIDNKKALDTLESLINVTNEPVGGDLDDEVGG